MEWLAVVIPVSLGVIVGWIITKLVWMEHDVQKTKEFHSLHQETMAWLEMMRKATKPKDPLEDIKNLVDRACQDE